ncbi:MAG: head-tail adaptor protein [Lachnospira sp.]
MIGGNIIATLQKKSISGKNALGESIEEWSNGIEITGWLDMSSGTSEISKFNAKLQNTTHIFICDYTDITGYTSKNSRMLINGTVYNILYIDDPMFLHEQLEIYLQYVGE